jgi:oligosaccharide reducing-end xylanase
MSVNSVACGTKGLVKTISDFKSKINEAIAKEGWCVFLIHDLDNGSGYSPLSSAVFKSSLYYCKIRNYKVWVSTFANVSKYIKERNAVSVTEVKTCNSIIVKVTDTLDNSLYNYPITLRRPLPSRWKAVNITQNGISLKVSYVKINTAVYAMFSVVPNSGDIILKKHSAVIEPIDLNFEETDTVGTTPAVKPSSIKIDNNDPLK